METAPPHEPVRIVNSVGNYLHAQPSWLVEGLIEEQEQVLLFGPPKIGKSQLAMQLALAVARGQKFLRWNVPRPRRVLYLNFEIGLRQFVVRLARHILNVEEIPPSAAPESLNQELVNFHYSENARSMDVLSSASVSEWAKIIEGCTPEFIVFDTLSKTHFTDERDNHAIQQVLLELRKLAGRAAHVIVHHARKNPNVLRENADMTTESIRGGSAIRGEADLILALSNRAGGAGGGKQFRLGIEARNIKEDELNLHFTGWGPFAESDAAGEISEDANVVLGIFQKEKSRVLAYWIIRKGLADARGIGEDAASDRLKRLKQRQPPLFATHKRTQVANLEERYPHQFQIAKKGDLAVVPESSEWFEKIEEAN